MTLHPLARVLWWWLLWHPAAPLADDARPVRLIDRPCLHVGVRAHAAGCGAAITLQVSGCAP